MRIRFAEERDVEAVVDLGQHMHGLSRFESVSYSREKVRGVVQHAVDNPAYMIAVAASRDGRVAGFHLANMERYFFGDDWLAQSINYFVLPEYRGTSAALRLLQIFRKWGERRGARELVLGTGTSKGVSLAQMDRFVRRCGFDQVGGLYSRWVG